MGVATLTPMLKNHSDFIGLKVAKYTQLFCLNMTESEAFFMAEDFFCGQFRSGVTESPRVKTLPSLGTGSNLRATAS